MSSDSHYAVTFSARDAGEEVIVFRLPHGALDRWGSNDLPCLQAAGCWSVQELRQVLLRATR
jgi:hypothetical protein